MFLLDLIEKIAQRTFKKRTKKLLKEGYVPQRVAEDPNLKNITHLICFCKGRKELIKNGGK